MKLINKMIKSISFSKVAYVVNEAIVTDRNQKFTYQIDNFLVPVKIFKPSGNLFVINPSSYNLEYNDLGTEIYITFPKTGVFKVVIGELDSNVV